MVDQLETVQKANGAMVRVIDLLAIEPDIRDEGTTLPPSGPLSVEFRDVGFDYGDDQPVLQAINLDFAAGRSIGIVGRTGSGKTTMSRLCCGSSRRPADRCCSAAFRSSRFRWVSFVVELP